MRTLLLALALFGCGRSALAQSCDPHAVTPPCGPGLTCSADCGPDLTCDVTGVCGVPCGNGNVVCDGSTLCDYAADCIPACLVDGAPQFAPVSNCFAAGLIPLADGRCLIPCYYFACTLVGGTC